MTEIIAQLVEGPLPGIEPSSEEGQTGAELVFRGIVRGEENGEPIVALFYEAYAEMAAKELLRACEQAAQRHDLQSLHAWHRVGEVPVDEVSLQIAMRSRHRESGLEAMAWLIREIKTSVPIWKWGVAPDGRRFPAAHVEHEISGKTG